MRLARLVNHHRIKIADNNKTTPTRTGNTMERMESVVETTSSNMLTGTLPAPAVLAVMAGRTAAALTAWTLPATSKPAMIEMMG